MKGIGFIAAVLAVFIVGDTILASSDAVSRSNLFRKNDYEKTVLSNGGRLEYDHVFYGNSVLVSAFIEEESATDYVNFGMDYATITDLRDMLKKGMLKPKKDLVLALNYFVLLDTLDTNPTYPWHRKTIEPYVFFERDRLHKFLISEFTGLFTGQKRTIHTELEKAVYYGVMTDEELDTKINTHNDLFWGLDTSYYKKNLAALKEVIKYCADNGVRLRAIWMPWNGYTQMPEVPVEVARLADEIMSEAEIEVYDMLDAMPRDCFHDLGHLNYEHGAHVFTQEADKWLIN